MTHISHDHIYANAVSTGLFAARQTLTWLGATAARGTVRAFAAMPGAVSSVFAAAYADPFSPPARKDDWSNPENY